MTRKSKSVTEAAMTGDMAAAISEHPNQNPTHIFRNIENIPAKWAMDLDNKPVTLRGDVLSDSGYTDIVDCFKSSFPHTIRLKQKCLFPIEIEWPAAPIYNLSQKQAARTEFEPNAKGDASNSGPSEVVQFRIIQRSSCTLSGFKVIAEALGVPVEAFSTKSGGTEVVCRLDQFARWVIADPDYLEWLTDNPEIIPIAGIPTQLNCTENDL